ncbi:hypothetical protein HYPSUDRAFT_210340 [Hypholoma sublateritium FD-334 SS-4]|uniref:Uncharacterized protein n=1 Tax=Hypholoma sublateritium (strain FD-334 SS-4) TaxID=945553 RepID=A0A0D2NVL6_HYPSF|nr:hypothetical protein HYPSUDRAFT_210340 [Hypholoma sublateritium FD-334 SS-4]
MVFVSAAGITYALAICILPPRTRSVPASLPHPFFPSPVHGLPPIRTTPASSGEQRARHLPPQILLLSPHSAFPIPTPLVLHVHRPTCPAPRTTCLLRVSMPSPVAAYPPASPMSSSRHPPPSTRPQCTDSRPHPPAREIPRDVLPGHPVPH